MTTPSNDQSITLTVSLVNNSPTYQYSPAGPVQVYASESIIYNLNDQTGLGLFFADIGFLNPFNNIIDQVIISPDGKTATLIDLDNVPGTTDFQFIFNYTKNDNKLLLISPDPQVINHDTK
ncbi:MAG: hypothetical protein MHMPM18_005072 [Marteilia pararefringens]